MELTYCNDTASNASSLLPLQLLSIICYSTYQGGIYGPTLEAGILFFISLLIFDGFQINLAWRTNSWTTKLLSITATFIPITAAISILDPGALIFNRIKLIDRIIIFQLGVSFAVCSISLFVTSFIDILIENDIVKNNFKVTKFVVMIGGCVASVIGFIFVLVAYMTLSLSLLIIYYGVLGFIIFISILVALIVVFVKLYKMDPKNHFIDNMIVKLNLCIVILFLAGLEVLQIVIVILVNYISLEYFMASLLISYLGILIYFSALGFILFPPRYYKKYIFCCCNNTKFNVY